MDTTRLLSDEQFGDVMATVLDNNDGMATDTARRIVVEAMKFVATAARYPTIDMAPSRTVDEGWHALILHTALYANMCEQLGGFVHHYPERPDTSHFDTQIMDRTCSLIERAGYSVNEGLWAAPENGLYAVAASCQHSGGPNGPITPIPRPGKTE